jgi:transcriptional regulator with XRE-family HTH domain
MTPTEIQKAANARKTSMRKILRSANVQQSTWWRWKTGRTSPSLKTVTRIVDAVKGGSDE